MQTYRADTNIVGRSLLRTYLTKDTVIYHWHDSAVIYAFFDFSTRLLERHDPPLQTVGTPHLFYYSSQNTHEAAQSVQSYKFPT